MSVTSLALVILGVGYIYYDHVYSHTLLDVTAQIAHKQQMTNTVENPQVYTTDRHGTPIDIHAKHAEKYSENKANFCKPSSVTHYNNGEKLKVSAQEGHFKKDEGIFNYQDNVEATFSKGYHLRTDAATSRFDSQQLSSTEEVNVTGPLGKSLSKKGACYDQKTKILVLYGDTEMTITMSKPQNRRTKTDITKSEQNKYDPAEK